MLLGHYAAGFTVKRAAPKISLGTCFFASQFLDLLWPILLLLGVERVNVVPGDTVVTPLQFTYYPVSHSLLMVILWATGISLIFRFVTRSKQGAGWIWLAVMSHWFLDVIVHRADLPLYPGGKIFIGLGLWNSLIGSILFEVSLFCVGVFLYVKKTEPLDKTGVIALWSLICFLSVIYLGNIFGPPPPDNTVMIAGSVVVLWLLVVWGYWIDRHREEVVNGI
ncbi:hypothetical protein ACFL30_03485 [Candidatus Latescibacterota bacterium]